MSPGTAMLLMTALSLLVAASVVYVFIRIAKRMFPVGCVKAIVWSFKKRIVAPPLAFLGLLFFSVITVVGLVHTGAALIVGRGEKIIILGATNEKFMGFDPDLPEREIREFPKLTGTHYRKSHYFGQSFNDLLGRRVFMRVPWSSEGIGLPWPFFAYLFMNILTLLFFLSAAAATAVLLMRYAAGLKMIPQILDAKALAVHFAEKTGISFSRALLFLSVFTLGVSAVEALLNKRFEPLLESMKPAEEAMKSSLLSHVHPGVLLKGRIVNKDWFLVRGTRKSDAGSNAKHLVSDEPDTAYWAYLVEFRDLVDSPVFVSLTEVKDRRNPSEQDTARIRRLDELLASRTPANFCVQEDLSISLRTP